MQPKSPEQEVDRPYLTDLVRKALNRPALQFTDWKATPIHGGMEWNSAVFRFQGEAKDGGETIPWSMILKVVKPIEKAGSPGGIWYWKGEVLAYQSGLLHSLPGGNVTAPTLLEIQERPDGSIWLWMEDVKDDIGSPWPIEQYASVARHLGQFNGAYLTGQVLPSEPWITHNWLRMYIENAAKPMEFIRNNPNHPVIRHVLPGDSLAQVMAIWDEHGPILDLLDALPQVLCHQDAFKRNLFTRQGKTIAIDWGYMGVAPVGAELVALIAGSMGFWEIPAERVMEMDHLCFVSYLQGLRDAGWNGNSKLVRIGYVVTLMLRYPIGGTVGEEIPGLLDRESRSKMETTLDKPAEEIEKTDPAIVAYYQSVLPEALKLLGIKRMLSLASRIGIHTLRLRAGRKK